MRSDTEMMNLILEKAKTDDRILAVYLKGSRTNPNAPADIYRDFDIVYVVKETESFLADPSWVQCFGKVVLKQEQDSDYGYGDRFGLRSHYEESYSWLLLFADGNRIDVGIETLPTLEKGKNRNKLYLPLLDKVNCLPQMPPPTDEDFHVKRPSARQFQGCCNEFYWCLCDVGKGIVRDELPFAMTTYNTLVREMLELLLSWYVGFQTDFSVSTGKLNKYLKRYLPDEIYREYLRTYTDSDYSHFWCAIDDACSLFHEIGVWTAEQLGVEYPQEEEEAARAYLQKLRGKL